MATYCTCLTSHAEEWRAIAEVMAVPAIVSCANNGIVLHANALFGQTFGYSERELIGHPNPDFYCDSDAPDRLLEKLTRDGGVRNCEICVKTADGTPVWVAASFQKVAFGGDVAILATFCAIGDSLTSRRCLLPATAPRFSKEALLEESEERYRQLAELSADATILLVGGKFTYVNASGVELMGAATREALAGKPLLDFIHPDSQERFAASVLNARSPSTMRNLILKLVSLDGEVRVVQVSGAIVTVRGEPAVQLVLKSCSAASEDDTHGAGKQEGDREQVRAILEAVPGIVSWVNSDLRYLAVNRRFAELYGLHPDDFIGQEIGFLSGYPEITAFARQVFAGTEPETIQEQEVRANGSSRTYLLGARKSDGGKTAFLVGIDISDSLLPLRKNSFLLEAAREKSEANLRALLNSRLQSILLIGRDYKIKLFNKTAREIAQLVWKKTIQEGDSIYEYVAESDRESFTRNFHKALLGNFVKTEKNVKGSGQQDNWFEIAYQPVIDEGGEVSAVYFSALNIDKQKKAADALAISEKRFRSLVQNSSDIITILEGEGTISYESPSIERILGYEVEELIGKNAFEYVHPEDRETVESVFAAALQTSGDAVTLEFRFRHANGSWVTLEAVGRNLLSDPAVAGFVVNSRDITQRKQQEERLRLLERAIAASSNGISITDAQQRNNPTVYVNPSFEKMTGYNAREAIGRNLRFLQGKDPNQPALDKLRAAIRTGKDCKVVLRNYRKDGTLFWNELQISPVYNDRGQLTHFIGVQTDITDRKLAEEQLIYNAFHDGLTGLPNRGLLMARLRQAVARGKQHPDYLYALLFLDLDRFKVVNDSLGHSVGDQLLIAIARRLEACISRYNFSSFNSRSTGQYALKPQNSLVARLGGDHFVILLEGMRDIGDAAKVAEQIHKELVAPFALNGYEVFISTSIGIATSCQLDPDGSPEKASQSDRQRPEELLRDADLAMYHAKAQGKACYAVFDKAMHDRALALLQLENDLRRAISVCDRPAGGDRFLRDCEPREFQLYYQPIVGFQSGRIVGFEALVRWNHPERGLVSPAEFIPVAEETGLILPLGIWVLREACRQMAFWQKQFARLSETGSFEKPIGDIRQLTVSVNLSGKQFLQPDLVEQIDRILQETGLDASCLKLEITESAIVDNIQSTINTLWQLRSRNIQLSLDDFGTGYSSLSYLHRFPIDTLKIDRSFVSRIGGAGENIEIVKAIVMLAHSLGMNVVAEGAETKEQLAQLRSLGCECGQGYFFSKPLPATAAEALLAASPQW